MAYDKILLIFGIILSLIGAYIGSTIPLIEMLRKSTLYGGPGEDYWNKMENKLKWKFRITNVLLLSGAVIQILCAYFIKC